jgi:hypothetical protein
MNRSILIVICDFLMLSLLAFSSVDVNKVSEDGAARSFNAAMPANPADGRQDLGSVMRLALEEERKGKDALLVKLDSAQEALAQQQALSNDRQKQVQAVQQRLDSSEQQARQLQQELDSRGQQARQLQQELDSREQQAQRLQTEKASLQQQYAAAQTNLQALDHQLQNVSVETVISKEKLAAMEAEAKRQSEQAAALQQKLGQLEQTNQLVLTERQRLAKDLAVAETERRSATEQVNRMQAEVKVEREEKAKLAEGVKALASRSEALTQEIREHRPLAPNTIFNEFVGNQVQARFFAQRSGFLGDANRRTETQTVLVSNGTNTFALCHLQDTPLALGGSGTDWQALTGTLGRNSALVPVSSMAFYLWDPRLVWMPVTDAQAKELGGKVYHTSADPYQFQDAVVVGAGQNYYGECKFQIDLTTPQYVKMDRSSLKGLFGQFNPSRGDLVFSHQNELLGIMVNNTYCLMIRDFTAAAALQFSADVRSQHTGETLSQLYAMVNQLPAKLQ